MPPPTHPEKNGPALQFGLYNTPGARILYRHMNTGIAGIPLQDVAAPLRDAWVRFHQANLCLGIDTLFVFHPKGMEVWCRIKDDRAYQRFSASLQSLRMSFEIVLYPTRADREKKPYSPDDDSPPPSFWTNAELRGYMRDPNFSRVGDVTDDGGWSAPSRDPELKRRLKLYGDDLLSQNGRMEHLAGDLPALAAPAFGDIILADLRPRARAVCIDHAREISKCAARLGEDLSRAFPRPNQKSDPPPGPPEQRLPAPTAYDLALALSSQALEVAQRIIRFIYPQAHTVNLSELKRPSLLESLKALQDSGNQFIAAAHKSK